MASRIEKDSFGEIEVPAERLWGAQTQRSLQNFRISGERMPLELIHALARVKRACALVNAEFALLDEKKARAIIEAAAPGSALSEWQSKQVLAAYGIRSSKDVLCNSAAAAVKAAGQLGYPVVMKVSSPDLLHKSDLGLVKVGVANAKEVRAAYAELVATARKAGGKNVRLDGVLVSELVSGGVETVVGVSQDPLFGPVVMAGLGGIFVEVLGDVTFRVPPFGSDQAAAMLDELSGAKLLDGVRGAKPADRAALVDVIMKVQRLAMDLADVIGELDVNPLVVRPKGAVALDALIVRAERAHDERTDR